MKDEQNNSNNETKLLGGQVPKSLYWAFKDTATKRRESMRDAIIHAALLYINIGKDEE